MDDPIWRFERQEEEESEGNSPTKTCKGIGLWFERYVNVHNSLCKLVNLYVNN